MRPASLGEFVGQEHLLGRGSALRGDRGGPPALDDPVRAARHREDDARPAARRERPRRVRGGVRGEGRPRGGARGARARGAPAPDERRATIFFLDEIHRFNKAQQDTLLPAVEDGLVVLVGATTENPYFEVNSALLSRCRIYELHASTTSTCSRCCGARSATSAASPTPRGGRRRARVPRRARGGDARTALSALELAAETVGEAGAVTLAAPRTRSSAARSSTTRAATSTTT